MQRRQKFETLFNVKPQFILDWLNAKGQNGKTLTEGFMAYLDTKNGGGSTLSESLNKTLTNAGYTGTLHDKLNAFYVAKTSIMHPKDAELAFYNTPSLDFGSSGATKFVILDPTDGYVGNNITVTVQAQKVDNSVDTSYQTGVTLVTDGSATGGGLVTITNGVGTKVITDAVSETVNLTLSDTQGTGLNVASTQNVLFAQGGIDSFTKLMLHLDNNATDSELTPKTVTNNSVTFDSTKYKFGGYSAIFNGSTAYLTTPSVSDWQFGTGNLTVDFWFYPTLNQADWSYLIGTENWGSGSSGWCIIMFGNHLAADFETNTMYTGQVGTVTFNAWNHVALVRNGTAVNLYLNGTSVYSTTSSINITGSNALNLGKSPAGTAYPFTGYIDEPRVSKGIARWTSDFTPPAAPYST